MDGAEAEAVGQVAAMRVASAARVAGMLGFPGTHEVVVMAAGETTTGCAEPWAARFGNAAVAVKVAITVAAAVRLVIGPTVVVGESVAPTAQMKDVQLAWTGQKMKAWGTVAAMAADSAIASLVDVSMGTTPAKKGKLMTLRAAVVVVDIARASMVVMNVDMARAVAVA